MQVTLTCPNCSSKQEIEAPEDRCLAMYSCGSCHKVVKAPSKKGECTCVICEYSDSLCPVEQENK